MDRARLVAELLNARFQTTQFRSGYDEAEVDDFVDVVVSDLQSGVPGIDLVDRIERAGFSTTTFRRGYDCMDVDALLDRVMDALKAEPVGVPVPEFVPAHASPSGDRRSITARVMSALRGDPPPL